MWHLWIVESYNIPSHNNNNPWIFYTIIYKNWLYTIIYTWTVYSQITDVLHHSFRHHPNGVFQCLSLVAEPYSYHLPFVAQLVRQSGDLRPCTKKKHVKLFPRYTSALPEGCVFLSKWAFRSSNAWGVNDVLRFRFFDGSMPMKSVKWFWPLLYLELNKLLLIDNWMTLTAASINSKRYSI